MSDELVTVATFSTASEADAAKLTLESEGIRALIGDMDWNSLGIPAANVSLQVAAADAATAAELLAHHGHTLVSDEPDESVPDQITCLECGTAIPEGQARCTKCGWTYVA